MRFLLALLDTFPTGKIGKIGVPNGTTGTGVITGNAFLALDAGCFLVFF